MWSLPKLSSEDGSEEFSKLILQNFANTHLNR